MPEATAGQPIVMVAMGGHAFIRENDMGGIEEHERNSQRICERLMTLVHRNYNLVLTHGNGPQVGWQLIKNELTRNEVPSWPLDVLVAETEGSLGYMLQQAMLNQLRRNQVPRNVVSLICQVLVDAEDPAFRQPNKPIGPWMSQEDAETRRQNLGWEIMEDQGRGWRRAAPSPMPLKVVQWRTIRDSTLSGHIVIACGGGGIPIVKDRNNDYVGVEAVVDKDLTTSVLGTQIGAQFLIILSDVPNVYLDYDTPEQRPLHAVTLEETERFIGEGHFPDGSMGPKVEAIHRFLKAGGRRGIITSPECLVQAMDGRAGTHFIGKI